MQFSINPTGAACGATITGLDLAEDLTDEVVAELRALWLAHKVLIFPDQTLSDADLERFTLYFGAFGEDPFFEAIPDHPHIAAIERRADERTPIFAGLYHTDWSFLEVPPAGTVLYGLTIPPHGGDTLFADQVAAYERLPAKLKQTADQLIAIHSAERGYAPDGLYGEADQQAGRSMQIRPSERAREKREHPFVRIHPETGQKALFSSPAYIQGFKGMSAEASQELLMQFYPLQVQDDLVYTHKWRKNMLVMWDNRTTLHAASGGYDGYDRLLHRTTIADTRF